jgi:REP element-mobilizing transposase RayT
MARAPRILIPGGYYHVTCRGNERRSIYKDHTDRTALRSFKLWIWVGLAEV